MDKLIGSDATFEKKENFWLYLDSNLMFRFVDRHQFVKGKRKCCIEKLP
jgi:hypothetical protein